VLPLVSLIVFQAFVLSLGALFRLLLAYLNPPHRTGTFHTVHRLASLVYGLLLLGNVLFVLSFADMILAWHVLSTFAFPARTLRQTAAIAALAYVALSIGSQILGPQAALRRQAAHGLPRLAPARPPQGPPARQDEASAAPRRRRRQTPRALNARAGHRHGRRRGAAQQPRGVRRCSRRPSER